MSVSAWLREILRCPKCLAELRDAGAAPVTSSVLCLRPNLMTALAARATEVRMGTGQSSGWPMGVGPPNPTSVSWTAIVVERGAGRRGSPAALNVAAAQ